MPPTIRAQDASNDPSRTMSTLIKVRIIAPTQAASGGWTPPESAIPPTTAAARASSSSPEQSRIARECDAEEHDARKSRQSSRGRVGTDDDERRIDTLKPRGLRVAARRQESTTRGTARDPQSHDRGRGQRDEGGRREAIPHG